MISEKLLKQIPEHVIFTNGMTLDDLEREAILKCLKQNHFNKARTAQMLGISARCLDYKLDRYEKNGQPADEVILPIQEPIAKKIDPVESDETIIEVQKKVKNGKIR